MEFWTIFTIKGTNKDINRLLLDLTTESYFADIDDLNGNVSVNTKALAEYIGGYTERELYDVLIGGEFDRVTKVDDNTLEIVEYCEGDYINSFAQYLKKYHNTLDMSFVRTHFGMQYAATNKPELVGTLADIADGPKLEMSWKNGTYRKDKENTLITRYKELFDNRHQIFKDTYVSDINRVLNTNISKEVIDSELSLMFAKEYVPGELNEHIA